MQDKDWVMSNGECFKCEFFKDDHCMRAERLFSTMVDPICLAKLQVMLLRDISMTLNDYVYDNDGEGDENNSISP